MVKARPQYRVLVGLDYPPGKRAEPGDIVDDIPPGSTPWLLRDKVIEKVPEQPEPDDQKEDVDGV